MENKDHVSIKSPKEKPNIKHIKYILIEKELIQVFIFFLYIMASFYSFMSEAIII